MGDNGESLVVEMLRQQADSLADLKRSQTKQTEELHSIRVEQAGMAGRMDAMTSIPTRVANLETKLAGHHETLLNHSGLHANHIELLGKLRTEADERRGWQGPLGKIVVGTVTALLVLLLGAVLAFVGIRNARAAPAPAPDLRFDKIANAKCWAVPPPRTPKYLRL